MIESVIKNIPLLSEFPRSTLTLEPLSGLTNINYLVSTPDNKYVLRIPKHLTNNAINRNHEAFNSNIIQRLKLCPATFYRQKNESDNFTGLSLTEYIEDSTVLKSQYFQDPIIYEALVQSLVTLQSNNKQFKGNLDNQKIIELLKAYFRICPTNKQQVLLDDYQTTLNLLSSLKDNRSPVSSHIDLIKENILISGNKVWLIDWEYSSMASPFWDIATLCNSLVIEHEKERLFLKAVLGNIDEQDIENLKDYKRIINTISLCWEAAFIDNNSEKN